VAPILGGYLLAIGVAPTRIFLVDCFFALIAAASTVCWSSAAVAATLRRRAGRALT
jgi:hypothetical protein